MSETTREAAFKAEQQRQTDALCAAIDIVMRECAQRFEAPILNAVAGALASQMGHVLLATRGGNRKALRAAMNRAIDRVLREHPSKGQAQVVVVNGDWQ